MAKSLRDILEDCEVFEHNDVDAAHEQILEFACLMHNRVTEKQKEISGSYDGDESVDSWKDNRDTDVALMLLDVGKNLSEAGEAIASGTVAVNSLVDVANISMIVDGWLRDKYSSN